MVELQDIYALTLALKLERNALSLTGAVLARGALREKERPRPCAPFSFFPSVKY